MTCVTLELTIAAPILLELVIDPGYQLVLDQVPGAEPLFIASEAFKLQAGDKDKINNSMQFGSGEKKTGTDAGTLWQVSFGDDYIYVCVIEGIAGVAIWKKALLFQT